jgi:rRNA-processing protein FCF1
MTTDKQDSPLPLTWLTDVYPEPGHLFETWLKPVDEIASACLIVLDTNVLLTPYTVGPRSLDQIRKTYETLIGEQRLKIPAQVSREFVKNRAQKLEELHSQLVRKQSALPKVSSGRYPLLEPLPQYQEVTDLEKTLDELHSKYRRALGDVLDHMKQWSWNDPVSSLYSSLFSVDVLVDVNMTAAEIETELRRRYSLRQPPGYKDAHKPDQGVGDLLIWLTILELARKHQQHVIFVTGEEKADWWHRSEGQALYPRFELAEEFRRASSGKSFHIARFSAVLDLFGAEATVVEEIKMEEVEASIPESVAADRPPLISDPRGEARLAEKAVRRWAKRRYEGQTVEQPPTDGPDILILDVDDENIGIDVVVMRGSDFMRATRRVRELAVKGHWYTSKFVLTVYAVAIVAESQLVAKKLVQYFRFEHFDLPTVHLHIGFVRNSRFVEVEEVRLSEEGQNGNHRLAF